MLEEIQHINHAIIAKAHSPMYLMHKYWARKPHNVVAEYIKHYSKEGDIILDPFAGSGVTAIEALKLGRKAIAIDLNPMAEFIIKNTLSQIKTAEIEKEFKQIELEIKKEIEQLYETKCQRCKEKATTLATVWVKDKEKPQEIRAVCQTCNEKFATKPKESDFKKIKDSEKFRPKWFPKTRLAYDGNEFKEGTHLKDLDSVDKLFTKRNLYALSLVFDEIENIKDKKMQSLFKFAFTSMVHLASKMCPVAKEGGKGHWSALSSTSFWPVHRYWVPPVFMESNVWMLFESAILGKQGVVKGLEDAQNQIKDAMFAKNFDELDDGANIIVETVNALELTKKIPANSIDYVFTDPPYGGAIQYFELSTLWTSWLKTGLDYADEITINKEQNKDFEYYHKMLKATFRELYQVLKSGKYLTVTFHSTDIAVWNSIVKAVVFAGFDLEKILYQPPARASAKGLLQPYGSAVGDYYIRFRKPLEANHVSEKQMDLESYERQVVFAAKEIIGERSEPTIYQHILNGIMVNLEGGRYVPTGARNIEEILKDNVGKEFALIPIKNDKGKIVGRKWWVKGWDITKLTTAPLEERIERSILQVLDKKIKATFDDILQAIFIDYPNAQTPDSQDIKTILEEYAEPTKDGKWRLKAGLNEKERENRHNRMIYLLAMLGKKARFDVWIGQKEQGDMFEGKPLSTYCDKIQTFQAIAPDPDMQEKVKRIDVLWIKDHRVKFEFEVESTTGISEAIIRGSNIINGERVNRFILIPKERENFLFRKLQNPLLLEAIKKQKWNFIRFEDLEKVFKKSKKTFEPEELLKIAKMPKETSRDAGQSKLNVFFS